MEPDPDYQVNPCPLCGGLPNFGHTQPDPNSLDGIRLWMRCTRCPARTADVKLEPIQPGEDYNEVWSRSTRKAIRLWNDKQI